LLVLGQTRDRDSQGKIDSIVTIKYYVLAKI